MPETVNTPLVKFLKWRAKHIPQKRFVLILSIFIGFFTGLVSVALKNTTHFIQDLLQSGFFTKYYNPYYFVFPVIGIIITVLIKKLIRHNVGEGVPSTLFAISRKQGFMRSYRMYGSFITSIFTVGFGGSVGLEGPAVSTGSAIGSNLGRLFHLNFKSRILMISCSTAGAIAAIFNAPIAAIIFTIEIFSLDLTFSSLIPLLMASASGAVTSIFLQGNDYLFHYKYIEPFNVADVPFYLLLGVLTAFASVYFHKIYFTVETYFSKFKSTTARVLVGGLLLGSLIFLIPPLYGEGYETINHLLNGNVQAVIEGSILYDYIEDNWIILLVLLGLVLFKVFATSFTMGAGGVGGVFAPALFIGSSLGFVFSSFVNRLNFVNIPTSNFTLVGMAGLMAGVLHAPLTAIFMIAEITGGYELFVPLMLVSAISFLVTRSITPHSIYTEQLAQKGDVLTHDKDHAILTLLSLEKIVETNFKPVHPEMQLGDLIKVVATSRRNLFPVVNQDQQLVGVLTLDDFRHLMFNQAVYTTTTVSQLMSPPPALIEKSEDMNQVMRKFQETGAWNLPVVDQGKYFGFISKSKLFSVYRRKLIEFN
ncbi:chloride channel protein [Owenweeksia hongkongensis]|uniref:Chloride channel protein EriC n=1 Tax=Owenweeksia hongkongensis (strain DSM 17368 / CIP 108786 / JCM 12287 / NRRL B-23963 / UST20020801) TaxID=926562 RepID=G8R3M3_OWEHD|nr:chloride channel protein [Owenweeksia hongkongensis]AEV33079.1 chloride channel protein EriC [Owenweeksia hongkongensis DSM 17368]